MSTPKDTLEDIAISRSTWRVSGTLVYAKPVDGYDQEPFEVTALAYTAIAACSLVKKFYKELEESVAVICKVERVDRGVLESGWAIEPVEPEQLIQRIEGGEEC